MRIDGFIMMPIFSFQNAITVYTGQNIGAGKLDRVRQGMWQCILMAFGTGVVIVAAILLFGETLAGFFTETGEIVDIAVRMLRIISPAYVVMSSGFILWGLMRGAGDAMTPMWSSFIVTFFIRIPVTYYLVGRMQKPEALFIGMITAWLLNAAFAVAAYRLGWWKTKGIIKA